MGFFDFFRGKPKGAAGGPKDKNVAKWSKVAGERLAQTYDRMEALENLAKVGSEEAASALLKRYTFAVEPSTTDQEEKEVALRGLVACGENALDPIRTACIKAESVGWPLKALRQLLEHDDFQQEIIDILNERDTDYDRKVDPKVQLLGALEGAEAEGAREAAARFLEDVTEPVRYQAVTTVLSMGVDDDAFAQLVELSVDEESQRLRNLVAKSLATHGWSVPEELRDGFAAAIAPGGFGLDGEGKVQS